MELVGADERRQREAAAERAGRATAPVPAPAPATVAASAAQASPVAEPPRTAVAPESASADTALTGRDFARLRAERRLSQRQLPELLGVGHGMVAKAEVAASEPLGERMRRAVAANFATGHGQSAG